MNRSSHTGGFTLVEVLITLAVSMIVIGAAVSVFFNMQKASTSLEQRSGLSLNARGAMYFIEDSIRLAGFNPRQNMSRHVKIQTAGKGELVFSRNVTDDLGQTKTIRIGLKKADDKAGGGADGIADKGVSSLVIDSQNVADDIVAVGFAYAFDTGGRGAVDLSANKHILWAVDSNGDGRLDQLLDTDDNGLIDADDGPPVSMISPVDISQIQAVKVWLLARTRYPVKGHRDRNTYVLGAMTHTPDNHYIHILHTTTIRCRNL